MQVINLYPDNQKVPDALYKLGRIYIDLGDMDIGQRYLSRVMENHPESSAAKLAITYSESLTEWTLLQNRCVFLKTCKDDLCPENLTTTIRALISLLGR